jgi:hypothetical protein
MNWNELDWKILARLREQFLGNSASEGPYWQSENDLANYDLTYAERIGWKWDAVLRELKLRAWSPKGGLLLDWGCGSGVAHRRVLKAFGAQRFDSLLLWDRSAHAMAYSEGAATRAFPGLNVCQATPGFIEAASPIGLLVVSHVLNELSEDALAELRRLILRAEAVLWVEAGTHEVARGLQAIRAELLNEFAVIAPCTHSGACPLLGAERERDWCHFFAAPPAGVFADSNWVRFGHQAGIDLRSLPYAFVALQKKSSCPPPAEGAETLARVIGRPEHFKPYARLLCCDAAGAAEVTVSKRGLGALYKDLERNKGPLVYRWKREDDKIVEGEPLQPPEA